MASEMVAPALTPAACIVGTAAIVATLPAASDVELGYVVAAAVLGHALMLAQAPRWRKADERAGGLLVRD